MMCTVKNKINTHLHRHTMCEIFFTCLLQKLKFLCMPLLVVHLKNQKNVLYVVNCENCSKFTPKNSNCVHTLLHVQNSHKKIKHAAHKKHACMLVKQRCESR